VRNSPDNTGSRLQGAPQGDLQPSSDELAARLRALDERLDRKQEARKAEQEKRTDNRGFAVALKLSTEFVAAILVGAALGFGLDQITGVPPWGMIFFLLLGFIAGVLNVLRSAGRIADPHARRADSASPAIADDEDDE
jgi:ATP synthase protein I